MTTASSHAAKTFHHHSLELPGNCLRTCGRNDLVTDEMLQVYSDRARTQTSTCNLPDPAGSLASTETLSQMEESTQCLDYAA